jgi:hypothetical protein
MHRRSGTQRTVWTPDQQRTANALHPGNVVARHFGIDHPNHWLSVRSPNTATYLMNIISVTMTSRQNDIFFSVYHLGR